MGVRPHLYCSPEAELPGVRGESVDEEEEEEGVGTKSSLRMIAFLEHLTGWEGWDILANTAWGRMTRTVVSSHCLLLDERWGGLTGQNLKGTAAWANCTCMQGTTQRLQKP